MSYINDIERINDLSISDIIRISSSYVPVAFKSCPWAYRDSEGRTLEHGTAVLETEEQCCAYMAAYGPIHVTISFDPSEELLIKTLSRNRFVCVVEFEDEKTGLAVVAKNKLFDIWDSVDKSKKFLNYRWYVSNRAIFEQFPVAVSPNFIIIDSGKIHHYLTGAKELENNGRIIRLKP